jgi:very-short-patch-repair endonuclease
VVNKVILPLPGPGEEDSLPTERAKVCVRCGYLHAIAEGAGPDVCERCETPLPQPWTELLRLQNVATRRRDRISSDEEERQRQGFEVRTTIRFAKYEGRPSRRTGRAESAGGTLAALDYGQAATIWRVNMGWSRRTNPNQLGFVLDTQRGYWARDDQATPDDPDDPLSGSTRRVIPFVEDRRNCLLIEPAGDLDAAGMASLQAALKRAIQAVFQLEEQELAAEPLPGPDDRRVLLFYESAEGGAGVLRRLLDDPDALARVAREALEICHFDPDTGEDRRHAPGATEDCEAACYDCLLSYGNQRDHRLLDRQAILSTLHELAVSTVASSKGADGREAHLTKLRARADSELERSFLDLIERERRRLPSDTQRLIASARARPDFVYEAEQVAVFIDGPHHDFDDVAQRDREATDRLEDLGWAVVRLRHDVDWSAILDAYPSVFGTNGAR